MYRPVLAQVHAVGFGGYSAAVAPDLLRLITRDAHVVEVGCGPGAFLATIADRGGRATGIDLSTSMVELARTNAPKADVTVGDWRTVALPSCDAVVAIGEVLSYGDVESHRDKLAGFFSRCRSALGEGGLLAFDVPAPGQARRRDWTQGGGWHCSIDVEERDGVLSRQIVAFALLDGRWERDEEVHTQVLLGAEEWTTMLTRCGFDAEIRRGYGDDALRGNRYAILARPIDQTRAIG